MAHSTAAFQFDDNIGNQLHGGGISETERRDRRVEALLVRLFQHIQPAPGP